MKELSPSDLFEIRPQALFSSQDYDYLIDLYAPIIGIKSVSVLLAMLHWDQKDETQIKMFLLRNQLNISEFLNALDPLEALGLVRSFRKVEGNLQHFQFCIYSPRNPKEFFDNVLFAGTLEKCVGEYELNRLATKYCVAEMPEKSEECSTTFRDFFHPDLEDDTYASSVRKTGGKTLGPIRLGFDRNVFMKTLNDLDSRISFDSFSKDEFVKIARYFALYNFDEAYMASFVRESYVDAKPFGQRIDFDHLGAVCRENSRYEFVKAEKKLSQAHGTSEAAKMIRKMERLSPIEYLSSYQKGNKPAKPDQKLIETLTVEMGLPDPVCNALISFVLQNNNNTLPSAYTEKVAGTLIREGIETAVDAVDYFIKTSEGKSARKVSGKKTTKPTEKKVVEETPAPSKESDGTMSQEEIDDFLDNLDFGDE